MEIAAAADGPPSHPVAPPTLKVSQIQHGKTGRARFGFAVRRGYGVRLAVDSCPTLVSTDIMSDNDNYSTNDFYYC